MLVSLIANLENYEQIMEREKNASEYRKTEESGTIGVDILGLVYTHLMGGGERWLSR